MSRHWYLVITLSAPALAVTVTSLVLCDVILAYRQRVQAEWLLRKAQHYFTENGSRRKSNADEVAALQDLAVCHEIFANYRKTARRKNFPKAARRKIFQLRRRSGRAHMSAVQRQQSCYSPGIAWSCRQGTADGGAA